MAVICQSSTTTSREYESLDELNHLACLLSELDKSELEKFEATVDSGEHTSSVADLINLVENLDCYEFYTGVADDETLGRIYAEDMELMNFPNTCGIISTMRRTDGTCGSTRTATLPLAVFS